VERDASGALSGTVTIRFEQRRIETCRAGEWRRIRVLSGDPPGNATKATESGWKLENGQLTVDFTANHCDDENQYVGVIGSAGFHGVTSTGGIEGHEQPRVVEGAPESD
jgi:hypothetical protein